MPVLPDATSQSSSDASKTPSPPPKPRPRMSTGNRLLFFMTAWLIVLMPFLFWWNIWFGRQLSDKQLAEYLQDEEHPRHIQHALVQIGERMSRHDASVTRNHAAISSCHSPPRQLRPVHRNGIDNARYRRTQQGNDVGRRQVLRRRPAAGNQGEVAAGAAQWPGAHHGRTVSGS